MSTANSQMMTVTFLHPRDGSEFQAEVAVTMTVEGALAELVKAAFISPPSEQLRYSLQSERTGKALAPSQSLEAAGVQQGERLAVIATNSGATA